MPTPFLPENERRGKKKRRRRKRSFGEQSNDGLRERTTRGNHKSSRTQCNCSAPVGRGPSNELITKTIILIEPVSHHHSRRTLSSCASLSFSFVFLLRLGLFRCLSVSGLSPPHPYFFFPLCYHSHLHVPPVAAFMLPTWAWSITVDNRESIWKQLPAPPFYACKISLVSVRNIRCFHSLIALVNRQGLSCDQQISGNTR